MARALKNDRALARNNDHWFILGLQHPLLALDLKNTYLNLMPKDVMNLLSNYYPLRNSKIYLRGATVIVKTGDANIGLSFSRMDRELSIVETIRSNESLNYFLSKDFSLVVFGTTALGLIFIDREKHQRIEMVRMPLSIDLVEALVTAEKVSTQL